MLLSTHPTQLHSPAALLALALCAMQYHGLSITPESVIASFVFLLSLGLTPAMALGNMNLQEVVFVFLVFCLVLPGALAACEAKVCAQSRVP